MMSSRLLFSQTISRSCRQGFQNAARRGLQSSAVAVTSRKALPVWAVAGTAIAVGALTSQTTYLDAPSNMPVISIGEAIKEPDTGLMFPPMVNGFSFMGCGVRIKFIFVKVYAVGAYFDTATLKGLKSDADIEAALLNPDVPRVIRIVINRSMTMDKYNNAIVEALTPRMKGQDLETLDEFKKLNPAGDLEKGSELLLTIRGDTLLYKNAIGQIGTIKSKVFTKAMCDVYFGAEPVSPPAKATVMDAVKKL